MIRSRSRSRKSPFRRPATAAGFEPIFAINTTPLIDMMLVLLIMFIVAIPITTHELPLDLPQPGPARPDQRPVHRLAIDAAGQTYWNGTRVDAIALRRQLSATAADP
ncbi:MAG: ExbD/TolR family protein, partial [Sphingomonas sp.]